MQHEPSSATGDGASESDVSAIGASESDVNLTPAPRVRPSRTTAAQTETPERPAPESAVVTAEADAATATPHAAPRTGRIEVPTPSVVRARERGRIAAQNPVVLRTEMLTKIYGSVVAAGEVSIEVHAGSFTGFVGPNGAGKTTTLSMISGLLRPSSGRVTVGDVDVWADGPAAKRLIGTLPDRLRLFDRLTGAQLLYYCGVLHGVPEADVAKRGAELAKAFGLDSALTRLVSDYSAGMQKKIALACSMIHAPEVLVLDEPFEAIDPVSAANLTEILEKYVAGGGSVVMSSHSLDLIQRVCDHVAIIVDGSVIAQGTVDEVRDGLSLEERFRALTGEREDEKGLEWLQGSSDFE
ncbi:ABC transporter ATP-binding protein [Leucobacter sp. 1207-22]|uniref:ABC transporter ATP-binding protein n=1 Tax=Leucobacter sp. 1207-22 TaxID=2604456 RepID=UPI0040640647